MIQACSDFEGLFGEHAALMRAICQRIHALSDVSKIVLFGSYAKRCAECEQPKIARQGNRTSFAFDFASEKSGVIDEFVDALVHDREPEVSGKEALTTMRTIFGSIRSSDIARPVAVNTDFVTHI